LLTQRWEHIDFARQVLSVTHSKTSGGEGREIPLTKRLAALLLSMQQPAGLVFTFKGRAISRIKTAWKATIRRSGVRYFRFHDLRHTFNTRLMEAGVVQDVRKALMGHSSGEEVNSFYTHVELPVKRDAIRKLEAWIETQHKNHEHSATQGESHGETEPIQRGTPDRDGPHGLPSAGEERSDEA
ncbi:MAG TPA: site-specific integrase, partial [Candidatus Sulfotelmatobacter sp.]